MRLLPANDEGGPRFNQPHLHAALRHFARHGLAAARDAHGQALAAADAGDRETYAWWLEVCRALDRRMARSLDRIADNGR
ncbi:hypothetical protein AAW00_05655 [Aurantiacibacter luteus]|uniref:Uncharacterized protein n=1 Tax=Aurantiacibacter luteus TaxID=1581420 RepID=A0A0G9N3Q0_9SPHN|nr:hypothetical protein AAW00_05655 [Aurantiacibacter luteus]